MPTTPTWEETAPETAQPSDAPSWEDTTPIEAEKAPSISPSLNIPFRDTSQLIHPPGEKLQLLIPPAPTPDQSYFTKPVSTGSILTDPVIGPQRLVRQPITVPEGLYNAAVKNLGAVISPLGVAVGPAMEAAGPLAPEITGTFALQGIQGLTGGSAPQLQPLTTGEKVERGADIAAQALMAAAPAIHFAGNLLPKTSAEALRTIGEDYAAQEREVQEGVQPEREGVATQRVPTEAGPGDSLQPETGVVQETQVPLGPTWEETTPVEVSQQGPGTIGEQEMGAAGAKEIPETGAGGEKYGIAQRIREERAQAGQVEPVEPGQGISAPDSVDRGRAINNADPTAAETLLSEFEKTKRLSSDLVAAVRAKGEELAQNARRIEEQFGTDSPEYDSASNALSEWDRRTKPVQTEWHKAGMAQQGWTDLDTGSFTGLEREFTDVTGRKFDESQKKTAKKVAANVRDAEQKTSVAKEDLTKTIIENAIKVAKAERESEPPLTKEMESDAEKRAAQAVFDAKREYAVRVADLENKARTAEVVRNKAVQDVQKEAARRASASAGRVKVQDALRQVAEENKARLSKAAEDLKDARLAAEAERKVADAKFKEIRDNAIKVAREEQRRLAHPEIAVWEAARPYLDKGEINFDTLRKKVAIDLGMTPDQVFRYLSRDEQTKAKASDLLLKQARERQLKAVAKRWLSMQDKSKVQRAAALAPRVAFGAKVLGHGTVALGTHSPMVFLQPAHWKLYFGKSYPEMYHMMASPTFYERTMRDLQSRDTYAPARQGGLANDPHEYEEFSNPQLAAKFGRLVGTGTRGYAVLKVLRQDLFDYHWNKLNEASKSPEMAKAIANDINHLTGVTTRPAPKGSALVAFAPRLLASRFQWLVADPVKALITMTKGKNATPAERWQAAHQVKEKLVVAGTLYGLLLANQGLLNALGSNQKINLTNPMASDWMKFKIAGMDVSYGSAMINMMRLALRSKDTAVTRSGKKRDVRPDENIYRTMGEFARSQQSPIASILTEPLLFKDIPTGRTLPNAKFKMPERLREKGIKPYTWPEWVAEKASPIWLQELENEVWRGHFKMSDEDMKKLGKVIAVTAIQAGTGGRISEDLPKKSP